MCQVQGHYTVISTPGAQGQQILEMEKCNIMKCVSLLKTQRIVFITNTIILIFTPQVQQKVNDAGVLQFHGFLSL